MNGATKEATKELNEQYTAIAFVTVRGRFEHGSHEVQKHTQGRGSSSLKNHQGHDTER